MESKPQEQPHERHAKWKIAVSYRSYCSEPEVTKIWHCDFSISILDYTALSYLKGRHCQDNFKNHISVHLTFIASQSLSWVLSLWLCSLKYMPADTNKGWKKVLQTTSCFSGYKISLYLWFYLVFNTVVKGLLTNKAQDSKWKCWCIIILDQDVHHS